MKVRCKNCHLEFTADDFRRVEQCPRCNSKSLDKTRDPPKPVEEKKDDAPKVYGASGVIHGDTKAAWKSFHQSEQKLCPNCGGSEFLLDFKRKEKTCKKCGDVLPLARRS
ncbi:TFIIB-type zinc ribbon-containing protein [Candidatus Micrarchaeota archaeon]|nr:TFIIB-type zinc ribbon-containing protein [Candidatus Micrarchaeota archaeon]